MPSGVKMGVGHSVVCNGKLVLEEFKQIPVYQATFSIKYHQHKTAAT